MHCGQVVATVPGGRGAVGVSARGPWGKAKGEGGGEGAMRRGWRAGRVQQEAGTRLRKPAD